MKRFVCAIVILSALLNMAVAQSTKKAGTESQNKASSSNLQPAAATNPVTGSGTTGRISKWAGVFGSDTFTLGDSIVFEDKFGKVGIGTDSPTSKLTVQGIVENTLGGFKFPDGTIQTTAAVSGLSLIFRDATLQGNATSGSPLGIAAGAVGTIHLANNAVSAAKIANGTVVRSLNGLLDNVQLASGANITITPSGSTLTIAAPNSLSSVARNGTLQGNGASGSPLGVAVPLNLTGAVLPNVPFAAVITVKNMGDRGDAVSAVGGNSSSGSGGSGVFTLGGNSSSDYGGNGVFANGGIGVLGGGTAVVALGGDGNSGGGLGIEAIGGESTISGSGGGGIGVISSGGIGHVGGVGVKAQGGFSTSASGGASGDGVLTFGGPAFGTGNTGGIAIKAFAGAGFNGATNGPAGEFQGNVQVFGNLSKSAGSFKIDHPLDPENKYLYHSFVESPDMKNIYDGTVTTDVNGDATVTLPHYFEALNKDFRYQLTVIGTFAHAIVADEIRDNRFTIKTNAAGVKVSWQVTGIRQDAYANKNRIKVEEDKLERERGFYLHPEVFNQPEERGVEWARSPETMQQIKETRLKKIEELKQKSRSTDR